MSRNLPIPPNQRRVFPLNSIGYCTNVHAGVTLQQVRSNLQRYALDVRRQLAFDRSSQALPVGLWLPNDVAEELVQSNAVASFRDWLSENQLVPYTLNGFPFADFHQPVVKQNVYLPNWAAQPRFNYTLNLARILHQLLPEGELGTISTLPIGWPKGSKNRSGNDLSSRFAPDDHQTLQEGAKQLLKLAEELADLESKTGRLIKVCLEPEPLCLLDCATDIEVFFRELLFDTANDEHVRRHIGVCHDVCHSAVMFEPQEEAIGCYRRIGIDVGKVQISSAVEAVFGAQSDRRHTWQALGEFAEPRYLHQTSIQSHQDESRIEHFEDLKGALGHYASANEEGETSEQTWRVHFHVPIFLSELDHLGTTQSEIIHCLESLQQNGFTETHLEVETYAWNVLPESQREDGLATGIAKELAWLEEQRT